MADNLTLPFGIQCEYDSAVLRTGTTPQLEGARERIALYIADGPRRFEVLSGELYRIFDGGSVDMVYVDDTEEIEYNGE